MSLPGTVVLSGFRPVVLQRPVRQEALLSYSAWLLGVARCAVSRTSNSAAAQSVLKQAQAEVLRFGVNPRHISRRQFNALPESEEQLGALGSAPLLPEWFLDVAAQPGGPPLDRRMEDHAALVWRVFQRWYAEHSEAPAHLIHVSCSGYASPSAAQRLVSERGWRETAVTHSYHMGCYGAFPAIRTAIGLLAPSILTRSGAERRVDILHTEYLSAHFDTLQQTPDAIIDNSLFADGFVGYSAFSEDHWARSGQPGLRLLAHQEEIIPGSLEAMSWKLGPRHFEMHLAKSVPLSIRDHLPAFVRRLCARAGRDFERDKPTLAFALHPGGPKILDHCRDALGISEQQLRHSRQVLYEFGNMSSASVPYILMRLCADADVTPGTRIIAAGFGPGLTATGLLLEKV